ncbi:MAG: hypothetical protein ACLFU0_04640 [Alphaproteobacteria bacterium]
MTLAAAPAVVTLAVLAVSGRGLRDAAISLVPMTRTAERFPRCVARRRFGLQVSVVMLGTVAMPALAGVPADWRGLAVLPVVVAASG